MVICPTKERDVIIDSIKRDQLDIKIYCPMIKTSESRNGIVKVISKPLLYGYTFWYYSVDNVPTTLLGERFHVRHLKFGGIPRFVTGREISRIRKVVKQLDGNFDRMMDDVRYLQRMVGRKVTVRDGSFTGLFGRVVDARRRGFLIIEIMIFNRLISCELPVGCVEFVSS